MKSIILTIFLITSFTLSLFANGASEEGAEKGADAVTTASIVTDADALAQGLSKEGTWIVATLNDITVNGDLVVDGKFIKNDQPYRKLALYTQDDNHKITASFTLTVDHLIIKSEHTKIQNGTIKGDILVQSKNFELTNSKVIGNVYFASDDLLSTFKKDDTSSISGTVGVKK